MRNAPLPGLIKNMSTQGYKRNSPDVNNAVNIIPSGDITMKGVDFKVKGTDNKGNTKVMKPGKNYKFPGTIVKETPLKEKWIQKAFQSVKKRGTEGVCTGSKFGSSSCRPGTKRYNMAKTLRNINKK